MNTREIAAEYRLAYWAQVLRTRTDKGLSVRVYCEETRIHENTYFYWQRKLREELSIPLGGLKVELKLRRNEATERRAI